MKYPGKLILILILIILYVLIFETKKSERNTNETTEVDLEEVGEVKNINYKKVEYLYIYREVLDIGKLQIYDNTEKRLVSSEILNDYGCSLLVNAGFYKSLNDGFSPIGLLKINGNIVSKYQENQTLNGFISYDDNIFDISDKFDLNSVNIIQSGPLLIINGNILKLSIPQDKPARRSLAVKMDKGLGFMIIFKGSSVFDGPYLEDLGELVNHISQNEGISVVSSINLDGGKASFFFDRNNKYPEITPVGSFFCLKD